jgi:hypothetical protein
VFGRQQQGEDVVVAGVAVEQEAAWWGEVGRGHYSVSLGRFWTCLLLVACAALERVTQSPLTSDARGEGKVLALLLRGRRHGAHLFERCQGCPPSAPGRGADVG